MSNKEIFIETYNKNIHRPGAEKLLAWLEGTDFFTAPASTRFHAAYEAVCSTTRSTCTTC